MTDESNEEVIGRAIANASAGISGSVVALYRVLMKKGLLTVEDVRESLDALKRPGFDEAAEKYYQTLRGQILRDL